MLCYPSVPGEFPLAIQAVRHCLIPGPNRLPGKIRGRSARTIQSGRLAECVVQERVEWLWIDKNSHRMVDNGCQLRLRNHWRLVNRAGGRGRESVHDNNNRGFPYFTRLLKYQRTYGVSVTDNSWTMDGWTPAAWAMASIQSCSWIMSGWRLIMILPVSVMKYVQIYPLLHRQ